MFFKNVLTSLLSLSLTSAALIPRQLIATTPAPLSDPFYTNPPSGWQNLPPGSVLNHRQVNDSQITAAKSAYQFLYTTRDQNLSPIVAIVTVLVPLAASDGTKHVAYSYAYDSAYANCDPSYALQNGAPAYTVGTGSSEDDAVNDALNAGYFVSTMDYEGPSASFTNGLTSGHAVLDGIRAALTTGSVTGISSSAKSVMWGYSGGALASEYAAELAAAYAPDVKVVGAVLGGLTPNIRNVAFTINGGTFAGIIPSGVQGLANAFPDLQAYLNEHFISTAKATAWNKTLTQCLIGDISEFIGQDLLSYFDSGVGALYTPLADMIINKVGIMGMSGQDNRNVPGVPLYFYKGAMDQISLINDTTALYNEYCGEGARIQYDVYPDEDHLGLITAGEPNAFKYVQARLEGTCVPKGCSTRNVTVASTATSVL